MFSIQWEALLLLISLGFSIVILAISFKRLNVLSVPHTNRMSTLDGLRGILALSVMAHHFYITYYWKTAGEWKKPPIILIDNFGGLAVSLFFLITGYLFICKIKKATVSWKELYLARVKRIVPLYIFSFLFVLFFTMINSEINAKNSAMFLKWIFEWLLFKGGNFQEFPSSLVIAGVQWTLTYEWKFYLALPLIFLIAHKKLPQWMIITLTVGFLFYTLREKSHHLYLLFILCIPAIRYQDNIKHMIENRLMLTHCSMTLLSFCLLFYTEPYSLIQMMGLSIVFAFIVNGYSFGVLQHKGLRVLGEISYSIYLLHGLVLYFLFSVINIIDFNSTTLTRYYAWFFLAALCVACLSLLTYKFIEQPFIRGKAQKQSNYGINQPLSPELK